MDDYYPACIADDDDSVERGGRGDGAPWSRRSAEIEGGMASAAAAAAAVDGDGDGDDGDDRDDGGDGEADGRADAGVEAAGIADGTDGAAEEDGAPSADSSVGGGGGGGGRESTAGAAAPVAEDEAEAGGDEVPPPGGGVSSSSSMADLIRSERERRLGARGGADGSAAPRAQAAPATATGGPGPAPAPGHGGGGGGVEGAARVLGNLRGWFGGVGGGGGGGGGAGRGAAAGAGARRTSMPALRATNADAARRLKPSVSSVSQASRGSDGGRTRRLDPGASFAAEKSADDAEDDGYDSSSSSSSSSSSDFDSDSSSGGSLDPRERARSRALRHLSDACVDAGRRAKTASYVRGLERLDLKRKRDRCKGELDAVEEEMNKDRTVGGAAGAGMGAGGVGAGSGSGLPPIPAFGEAPASVDPISAMAKRLARELPRARGADADAGAGGGDAPGFGDFVSYEEYLDSLEGEDGGGAGRPSPWDDPAAVEAYLASLRSRLREALDRARSLEKRLTVLENAGDDIVASLCEDLAEVAGHGNKSEARYVKRGKGMQRRRRREEVRTRAKIKKEERRVRRLEGRLARVSGGLGDDGASFEGCAASIFSDDSSSSDEDEDDQDDDDDEVYLERKLQTIKAKDQRDKEEHDAEVEAIRRQCEQLQLRLSVARLVMEGDDNLREYVALLERSDPDGAARRRRQRHGSMSDFASSEADASLRDDNGPAPLLAPAPARVARARAKLLKVVHVERIYERRLAVAKAHTDATIRALEQELTERETACQETEVRCLNELVRIDADAKEAARDAVDRLEALEEEARGLEEAVAACAARGLVADVEDMFGDAGSGGEATMEPPKHPAEEPLSADEKSIDGSTEGCNSAEGGDRNADARAASTKPWRAESKESTPSGNESSCDSLSEEGSHGSGAPLRGGGGASESLLDPESLDRAEKLGGPRPKLPPLETIESHTEDDNSAPIGISSSGDEDWPLKPAPDSGCVDGVCIDAEASGSNGHTVPTANVSKHILDSDQPGSLCSSNHGGSPNQIFQAKDSPGLKNGSDLDASDPQKKAVLEMLGRELRCTLSEYQTSFNLCDSKVRVGQLEYMNDLVLKIAKVGGLPCPSNDESNGESRMSEVKSWSFKVSKEKSSGREQGERKRSNKKKKIKKKRRRRSKEREAVSIVAIGPDSLDHSLVW
ncbi:hypothetical protein ACHAWF_010529 [Thalassiosira exigua]